MSSDNEGLQMDDVDIDSAVEADPNTANSAPVNTKAEVASKIKALKKSKDMSDQLRIAKELFTIASNSSSSSPALIELAKSTAVIVTLLQKGSEDVQKCALQILNRIGSSQTNAEVKKLIKKSGGIAELIRCLKEGGDLRKLALTVIGFVISKDENNVLELIEKDGVTPLIDSLSDPNRDTRFFAAACCWVFASHINHQDPLVNGGLVVQSLKMIADDEDIAWQSMGALRNLVIKNEIIEKVHNILKEANGLEVFKLALNDETKSIRIKQLIIQTLFVITSSNSGFKDLIRENGVIPVINELLQNSEEEDLSVKILQLLVNLLAKNRENQLEFCDKGGVVLLFELLQASHSEPLSSGIATALWASTVNNVTVIESISDNYLDFIQQQLILASENVLVGIVALLSNITSSSEDGQNLMKNRNMIPMIIDFLRSSHPPLLEATAGCIAALAKNNPANANDILEWDGALLLSRNLFSQNNGVKQNVAGALHHLLYNQIKPTSRAIKEVEGVAPLLGMLKEKSRPQLQTNATECLILLSEYSSYFREQIAALHGQFAITILFDSPLPQQLLGCSLVTCLAKLDETFRTALGNEDVVSKVIHIAMEKEEGTLEPSVTALWALCLNNDAHQIIARSTGTIEFIIETLTTHSTPLSSKRVLLKALASICGNNYANQEVVRLHRSGMTAIIGLLILCNSEPETNEYLAEAVTLTLWCLSTGNSRIQVVAKEQNALAPLVDLVKQNPDNSTVMLNGIGALCELCKRNSANKKIVKETNILDWLGGLEEHDNEHLQSQAKLLRAILEASIFSLSL